MIIKLKISWETILEQKVWWFSIDIWNLVYPYKWTEIRIPLETGSQVFRDNNLVYTQNQYFVEKSFGHLKLINS